MNDHQKGLYAFVVISFLIRFIVFTYEVLIVLRNAQNALTRVEECRKCPIAEEIQCNAGPKF